jgi:hypothetical protein
LGLNALSPQSLVGRRNLSEVSLANTFMASNPSGEIGKLPLIAHLAFPNFLNVPTAVLQCLSIAIISPPIGTHFFHPVNTVGFDRSLSIDAFCAAMPKTSMDEYH